MAIFTTLCAFTREVRSDNHLLKMLDHTYVQDIKNNYLWGCFGSGSEEGIPSQLLSETQAFLKQAQYLAGAQGDINNIHNHSEIYYGLQGVCHQAANRILSLVCEDVILSKGYLISWFIYGTYGRQIPLEIFYFLNNGNPKLKIDLTSFNKFNEAIEENMHLIGQQELPFILNKKSISLEAEQIELLLSIRKKLNSKFSELLSYLTQGGQIPEFLIKVNNELNLNLKEISKNFSTETYIKLFDFDPNDTVSVFDPNIVAKYFNP